MQVKVVRLVREPHPNASKVFVQQLGDGKVACMNIADWEGHELAAHVPPGAIVDTDHPSFNWLKPFLNPAIEGDSRYHFVTERMVRGVISYGLMVEAPSGSAEGDDVTSMLGVVFKV